MQRINCILAFRNYQADMLKQYIGFALAAICLSACSTTAPVTRGTHISLPDTAVYAQKDARWGGDLMGGSGAKMKDEGCLVTATAMALTNLGYKISPGDLNARLKRNNGYTGSGLLIWSAIERVTSGKMTARYYSDVNEDIIKSCLADGYYPLARFILPNGRTHWSMVVRTSESGYHMRDPLHTSRKPLIFTRGISGFKAIRCVGRKI